MNQDLFNFNFYKKTQISIDFFLGFLSSMNNFPNVNIHVSVFDIKEGDDSKNILNRILNKNSLKDCDLIVGPLFTDNFLFFSEKFRKQIPIISPFSKNQEIIKNNENVFQLIPDLLYQLSFFSDYIFDTHVDDNILLVRRDTILQPNMKRVNDSDEYFYEIDTIIPDDIVYGELFLNSIDSTLFSIEEIAVKNNIIDSIHHKLDTLGMRNIIIIPSNDNVFVTDLLSKLHACRDTSMVVYALPILSDFNHVSIYDLMDMKLTFPHNSIFNSHETKEFIIDFYNNYNYIPNLKYASVGYELGVYFLDILFNQGPVLDNIHNNGSKTILGTTYDFKKEMGQGYRNNSVLILRYNDFGYSRIH